MRFTNTVRQITTSRYYRTNTLATLRLLYARWLYLRTRVADVESMFLSLGVRPESALRSFEKWRPALESALGRVQNKGEGHGGISLEDGMFLYGITRALRPEYVVETGVAAGISSSFFGAALLENQTGQLISIELPPDEIGTGLSRDGSKYDWQAYGVGWAIPSEIAKGMEGRHTLILDDVKRALPRLVASIPYVDVFFHDDLHLPEHMLWEYELIWPKLRRGAMLISDDVDFGWIQFCRRHRLPKVALKNMSGLCATRKEA